MMRHAGQKTRKIRRGRGGRAGRRWVKTVTTASTFPPKGLFTKDAQTIARALASKRVSPKGAGSGLRMLSFFINRAGHQLSASRRAELERAKRLMKTRLARARRHTSRSTH